MRIRNSMLACAMAWTLVLAGGAVAQTDYSQPGTTSSTTIQATGTVVSSSPTVLVIRTDDGTAMTFVVDSSSRLANGLATGDRVNVQYHTTATPNEYHAATVTIASMGSTARTSSESTDETRELPETASPVAGLGLIGVLALAAGLSTKALRRGLGASR